MSNYTPKKRPGFTIFPEHMNALRKASLEGFKEVIITLCDYSDALNAGEEFILPELEDPRADTILPSMAAVVRQCHENYEQTRERRRRAAATRYGRRLDMDCCEALQTDVCCDEQDETGTPIDPVALEEPLQAVTSCHKLTQPDANKTKQSQTKQNKTKQSQAKQSQTNQNQRVRSRPKHDSILPDVPQQGRAPADMAEAGSAETEGSFMAPAAVAPGVIHASGSADGFAAGSGLTAVSPAGSVPPTRAQVAIEANAIRIIEGLKIDSDRLAEKFLSYYEARGWIDDSGNQVQHWQKLLRSWAMKERLDKPERPWKKALDEAESSCDRSQEQPRRPKKVVTEAQYAQRTYDDDEGKLPQWMLDALQSERIQAEAAGDSRFDNNR